MGQEDVLVLERGELAASTAGDLPLLSIPCLDGDRRKETIARTSKLLGRVGRGESCQGSSPLSRRVSLHLL